MNKVNRKCEQRSIEKTAEKVSSTYAEAVSTYMDIANKIQEKIFQTLAIDDAFSPRDLKALTGMLMDLKMAMDLKPYEQDDDGKDKTVIEFVNNDWD